LASKALPQTLTGGLISTPQTLSVLRGREEMGRGRRGARERKDGKEEGRGKLRMIKPPPKF
jgi:hypothetical protein